MILKGLTEIIETIKMKNNKQENDTDVLLCISKIFFMLFLLYYGWFQKVFFRISNMTFLLGVGMILFIVFHSLKYNTPIIKSVTFELTIWAIFALTSLFTGFFVAVNLNLLLDSLMTFIEYLILIFGMVYISSKENKIDYFINTYLLFSFICAITTIFGGVHYSSSRISMSGSTNPNSLGITMAIGMFCILYKLNFKKAIPTILLLGQLFLFFYVITLSGSRKSFLSGVIMILLWFIFVRRDVFKSVSTHRIGKQFVFMLILIIGGYLFFSYSVDSTVMIRLQRLFEGGDDVRQSMYVTAFELFKQSPLVGIGLDNFRAVTFFMTYSHSTYAEVLACTGIIGATLYFIPYISQPKKLLMLIRSKELQISINAKLLGILFIVLLFLGTGIIHFYDVNSYVSFGFIIAFCNLQYRKKDILQKKESNDGSIKIKNTIY